MIAMYKPCINIVLVVACSKILQASKRKSHYYLWLKQQDIFKIYSA